tara:strand:+ start:298 stop:735 length:438 start_codon:yes stop_codon:yes gene_type:complete
MTKKADHMKYKEGAKRSFRPNEWYINKAEEREVNNYLTGAKGGVPNNPKNIRSFQPVPAPINPAGSMQGDQVVRRNPYGDGEQIINNETPIFTKPNQRGSSFDPPPVPIEKPGRVKPFKGKAKRKGMSTSVGLMNTGPLRDISPN